MIFSKRKTIGVFISKMFRVFDEAFFAALDEEARRLDYDIAVFLSAGYYLSTTDYDIQEKNVIKFAPLEKLDGIIAVPSTYEKGEFRNLIYEMLEKRVQCPFVVVREERDGQNCVFTDNTMAMRLITRHLIEQHHLTKICMQVGDLKIRKYPYAWKALGRKWPPTVWRFRRKISAAVICGQPPEILHTVPFSPIPIIFRRQ